MHVAFKKGKLHHGEKLFIAFSIVLYLILVFPTTVSADPSAWTTSTRTPPSVSAETGVDTLRNIWDNTKVDNNDDSDLSWLNRTLGKLLASLGGVIELGFNTGGISMDSVIFGGGSLGEGAGTIKDPFHFKLESGNIYGYAGAIAYSALRQIVAILMAIMGMLELARCGVSMNGQDKARLKDYFVSLVFIAMMLWLMPNIVDYVIYLRSELLYLMSDNLKGALSSPSGGEPASFSITAIFFKNFENYPNILNGLMYTVSVGLMVFLMAMYVGNALTCTILFAFFPLIALLSLKNKGLFTAWLKLAIGTLWVPLFDGLLLFIPGIFYSKLSGSLFEIDEPTAKAVSGAVIGSLITLVMCFFIIPARKIILQAMGLSGVGAGEMAGLGAIGAMGAAAGKAKEAAHNLKESKADRDKKREEIAEAENQAGLYEDKAKADGSGGDRQSKVAADLNTQTSMDDKFGGAPGEKKADQEGEALDKGEQASNTSTSGASTGGASSSAGGSRSESEVGVSDDAMVSPPGGAGNNTQHDDVQIQADANATADTSVGAQGAESGLAPASSSDGVAQSQERINNLADMDRADKEIQAREENISSLNASNAALNKEAADIRNDMAHGRASEVKDANGNWTGETLSRDQQKQRLTEIGAAVAENNQKIQQQQAGITSARNARENARQIETAYAKYDKAMGGSGKSFSSPQEMALQQQVDQAFAAHANHKNFDSAQFAGHLSNADMAKLQRQRVAEMRREYNQQTISAVGGAAAAVAGGVTGGALAAMTGQMVEGAQTGAAVGSASVDAGSVAIQSARQAPARVSQKVQSGATAVNNAVAKARVVAAGPAVNHVATATAAFSSARAQATAQGAGKVTSVVNGVGALAKQEGTNIAKEAAWAAGNVPNNGDLGLAKIQEAAAKVANSAGYIANQASNGTVFRDTASAIRQSGREQNKALKPVSTDAFKVDMSAYNAALMKDLTSGNQSPPSTEPEGSSGDWYDFVHDLAGDDDYSES